MNFKFILQILNDDGTVKSEMQMKTLRDISNTLRIEYHQGRQLYLLNKKAKKLAHPFLIKLSERYKIIDNPALFEPLDIEL
jgi:hypothetical protein